jgi:CheY-like chemotaxis protein
MMTENFTSELEKAAVVTGRLTHDFGNYLTGILGFTELSLSQVPSDRLLHKYLQEVWESAQRGAAWIHRLHLFCRRSPAQTWPTVLATVLDTEEARLRSAGITGPRWTSKLPADLPLLNIDAEALQAALTELVNNAREASGDRAMVAIAAQVRELTQNNCDELLGSAQPGPHVELTVADDGPGMSPELHAKLFREMFLSTKPKHRGLGLLIVYGIMQRYHSGLRVAPPAGKGLTVQLYVPIASVERSAPLEKQNVLLVHTNPLLFESMKKVLEWSGCHVAVATAPQVALSAFATHAPGFALVITDVALPQISGLDFARRLLDQAPKANFLFLNTQASSHGLMEEDLLRRFALVRWPLEPQAFLRAVQNSLASAKETR